MLVELLECYKFYFMGLVYLLALFSVFLNFFVQQNKYLLLRKIINTLFSLIFIITWIQIGFGICEGLIQSFVITMLSMTYLAIGIQSESYSDNEHNVPAQVGGNL
jgi:F0F1-type ATP synthase membrane subunit a